MPYILRKRNGKRMSTAFLFNANDVHNLARDPDHCYVLQSPVTLRLIRVGGKCRKATPAHLWGAGKRRHGLRDATPAAAPAAPATAAPAQAQAKPLGRARRRRRR